MAHFNIEASNIGFLKVASERLNLGPKGPDVIVQVFMTLVMIVFALAWLVNAMRSGSSGLLVLAPLLIAFWIGKMALGTYRSARQQVTEP